MGLPLIGTSAYTIVPLGVTRVSQPVLCWAPWRDRKGRLSRRRRRSKRLSMQSRLLGLLYGFLCLPEPVVAAPSWFIGPLCTMATCAQAMARPPGPDSLQPQPYAMPLAPGRQHATLTGHCTVDAPWNRDDDAVPEHNRLSFEAVPWPLQHDDTQSPCRWVGVTLYTPHYKPHVFAVNIEGHPEPTQAVLDLVTHHGPSPASHLFNTVVPALPQRFESSVTLVRCHSAIRHMGQTGFAAVLVDPDPCWASLLFHGATQADRVCRPRSVPTTPC